MKNHIGIGVIGTGFARRTQIPGFAAVAGAKLSSVSSGQLANAESTAKEFGIPHFSDDWKKTVEREDVDIVCITTPPNFHLEMAAYSFAKGKHVLCEKPMAMNVSEAVEMTRLAAASNRMAIIDHELRFTNGRMRAYGLVREGKIGKIRHVKYLFRNASRGDAALPWTWWSDSAQGGGALGAIGSHVIDSLRWFTGADIREVFCNLHTHIIERPGPEGLKPVTTDDETMMLMNFGEGDLVENATATVSASMVEAGPYRNRIELFGTKGTLRIEDGGETYFADIKKGVWEDLEFETGDCAPGMQDGGWSRGFTVLAEKIVDTLRNGETGIHQSATFDDGLEIQRVLDAARESDESGCAVSL